MLRWKKEYKFRYEYGYAREKENRSNIFANGDAGKKNSENVRKKGKPFFFLNREKVTKLCEEKTIVFSEQYRESVEWTISKIF